jgi:hemolysin activation/secretion protein
MKANFQLGKFIFLLGCLGPLTALAQTPDAGALQQQLQREVDQERPVQPPEQLLKKKERELTPAKPGEQTIDVKGFKVTGITLITEQQAQEVLKPYTGRQLTVTQIKEAANAVTLLYQEIGRVAQATLPPQNVTDGIIEIKMIEGRMGDVIIERLETSPGKLKSDIIQKFLYANNPKGDLLSIPGLERSLSLLNELPGTMVEGQLSEGSEPGTSNITINSAESRLFSGRVDAANYGSPSTGAAQAIASLNLNNLAGIGDLLSLDAIGSQGSIYGQLKYGIPVGYQGWKVSVGASNLNYKTLTSYSPTISEGNAQVYGLYSTYALSRSSSAQSNFTLNYENKNYVNKTNYIEVSNYQLNNISAGFNGYEVKFDSSVSWGITATVGNLTIANTTQANNDLNGAATAGTFGKLSFNGAYSQELPIERTSAQISAYGQVANKNLNSAEQFYLGGPYGIRAYPVAQGPGSQGAIASVEVTHKYDDNLSLGAFFDAGVVQQYVSTYANWQGQTNAPNTYPLYATGLTAKYSYDRFLLQAALAFRVGSNPLYTQSGQQLNVDNFYRNTQGWIKGTFYF